MQPVPFTVTCPPALLARLQTALADPIFPDENLPDADTWNYGIPPRVLKKLVEHWRDKYEWGFWEKKINQFPHFKLECNGTPIHFIHRRSSDPNAVPLLLTHGWPGSFIEFLDIINPLAEPLNGEQAFHVVVPSLPGYGFSDPPKRKNFGVFEVAKTFDELMKRLGYEKYIAQGGDWGSSVSKALAIAHSTSCRAIHLNMLPFSRPPKGAAIGPITPAEEKAIIEGRNFQLTGTGYQRIQASKPQTIGAGLAGNPIGILAWIGEKFHEWTDLRGGDGDFSAYIGTDRLITNVMIYYISNTIASSFRLYHYQMQVQLDVSRLSNTRLEIPVGISAFPKEIFVPPKAWCEYWCPRLVQWTEPERGGHFAALENGGRLVEDVRRFGGLGEVKQSLGLGARL